MRGAIPAKPETQCDEKGKGQEQQRIPRKNKRRTFSIEVSVDSGEKRGRPEQDQESGEEHASDAEAHVQFHAANRDKRYLSDEQQNPAGKDRCMQVN
jgi:hypothetical protein